MFLLFLVVSNFISANSFAGVLPLINKCSSSSEKPIQEQVKLLYRGKGDLKSGFRIPYDLALKSFHRTNSKLIIAVEAEDNPSFKAIIYQGKVFQFHSSNKVGSEGTSHVPQYDVTFSSNPEYIRQARSFIFHARILEKTEDIGKFSLMRDILDSGGIPKPRSGVLTSSENFPKNFNKLKEDAYSFQVIVPFEKRLELPPRQWRRFTSTFLGLGGGVISLLLSMNIFANPYGLAGGFFYSEAAAPAFVAAVMGGGVTYGISRLLLKVPEKIFDRISHSKALKEDQQIDLQEN